MMKYYVGIDIGATNIRIGLVNDLEEILFQESYKSNDYAHKISEVIENFVIKYKNEYDILAISIGFPGLVDNETKVVIHTPNQKAFEGDYLKSLQDKLNIPIYIGNDVNYLLMFDAKYLNIPEDKSVLGFYLGTGFGNAIRIKDTLYEGEFGAAGEIGHVPMYLNGISYENKQNDLESFVSGFNLIKIHDKYFKDTPFNDLFIKHFNDPIIQNYLHVLAYYIVTEITILDISTIILGGGVIMSENFPKAYLETLIHKNLFTQKAKENLKIYYAPSHINSGIIGATIQAKVLLNKVKR